MADLRTLLRLSIEIEDPWEMMVYRALNDAAEAGVKCPTCDDLADLIDTNSVASTVNVVKRLERRGLIQVQRYQRERRVTIMATGKKTAEVRAPVPHWRDRDRAA